MNRIDINLQAHRYSILVENGLFPQIGMLLREQGVRDRLIVITHPGIQRHYFPALLKSLRAQKFNVDVISFPPGEKHKNLKTVETIYTKLIRKRADRETVLVSLGGGVVGDVTGMVAATYLRGVELIHIPTTLLAQVDSSIGGKTGVNHSLGKNLIGAFYHPRLVLVDPLLLQSLPVREISAALGEVIKYGIIWNRETFDRIENNFTDLWELKEPVLEDIISSCIQIKARVVEEDEKESYLRQILNFGHTFGHALEVSTGFKTLLHGEAVSLGMLASSRISLKRRWLSQEDFDRITRLILPLLQNFKIPKWNFRKISKGMWVDKKVKEGKLHFVLPREIGRVEIVKDVTAREIEDGLNYLNLLSF